ncbi:MAG: hypothetical protein RLY31_625 [Bacteroidota bacterium]
MSRRNKLLKFAEILSFPNVYEQYDMGSPLLTRSQGETMTMKEAWADRHFQNQHPVVLELACGKGDYTLALARQAPNRNFIGVDVKGARIWRGAKSALEEGLSNVAFLRSRIEHLPDFFAPREVDEIWITFPDPFLRKGKENRRLTAPAFLDRYAALLKPGGIIHLKTDDPTLYGYTLDVLEGQRQFTCLIRCDDIYAAPLPMPELDIKTYYEKKHLAAGKTIKYVRFRLEPVAEG